MNIIIHSIRKALNKAYLKQKPNRSEIEAFKANIRYMLEHTNDSESEEYHKNLVSRFLRETWYSPEFFINTKGRNDLVIHNGSNSKSPVGVIIETKKPGNKTEMAGRDKINTKAFRELVLYYLRERIKLKNLETKHLVITDIHEWFIFDANTFERLFAQNKKLVKQFNDFEEGRLAGKTTDFFYNEIAAPFIDSLDQDIEFTHFNIADYEKPLKSPDKESDTKLIALYKLLSPEHMLKLPFTNDSNSLDKAFYSELLHIIGLTETKKGNKKLIERKQPGERNKGSLLENAIDQIDTHDKISYMDNPGQFGDNREERLFNIGLELCITWINRILFLKLMEAQLLKYHKGDKSYEFLNIEKIKYFGGLGSLFFNVLAKKNEEREESVIKEFGKVPYLNSSLFEVSEIENKSIFISNLRNDRTLPLHPHTVLKDSSGKRNSGEMSSLQYLLEFLGAYDFSSEGSEEIQEENKSLINASVLGLIFEKINGYRDGSFFTPGFITMYMCRETIRRAVVEKFNGLTPRTLSQTERGKRRQGDEDELPPTVETQLPPDLLKFARDLRKESTEVEDKLWQIVRNRKLGGFKFRRQHPMAEGFILDFYCPEVRLALELDGGYHEEKTQKEYDEGRTYELQKYGIKVIRFRNEEVENNIEYVLKSILGLARERKFSSPPKPLSQTERGDKRGDRTDGSSSTSHPLSSMERGPGGENKYQNLTDIYNAIGTDFTKDEANQIINSLKICDPAVGSGHFLVSALNEIIAIKSELKILRDRNGKTLRDYNIEVVNDELIITDDDGELFEYKPGNKESQRVQETLFHEKQSIIENCLFGVDINPNSVKICRLRMWIELLKSAYYKFSSPLGSFSQTERGKVESGYGTDESSSTSHPLSSKERGPGGEDELETLPNIDINIKRGNSLISRFPLDASLGKALKQSKWTVDSYRLAVQTYRNAENKEQKSEMLRLINDIKNNFRTEISKDDPKLRRLKQKEGELFNLTQQTQMFERNAKEQAEWTKKLEKLTKEAQKLEAEIEEAKNNKIYENAFEWRFEFPEVLNDEGDFVGFDVVIGNPPYLNVEDLEAKTRSYYFENYETCIGRTDIYIAFLERSLSVINNNGKIALIIPYAFTKQNYGEIMRQKLINDYNVIEILDLSEYMVFDEAVVTNIILSVENTDNKKQTIIKKTLSEDDFVTKDFHVFSINQEEFLKLKKNRFETKPIYNLLNIKDKMLSESIPLEKICLVAYGARLNHKTDKIGKEL